MITVHPVKPSPSARGSTRRVVVFLLLVAVIAVASLCAELVFGRAVRWGERTCVEVWATFAMPLYLEQAFEELATDQMPQPAPSIGSRLLGAIGRAFEWTWQVEVEDKTDVAAVVIESRRVGFARLPRSLRVAGDRVLIRVDSVTSDGLVTITAGGQHTVTLTPGEGADFALVPALDSQPWDVIADGWRARIEQTLRSGQPVGRLSIVNHGLNQHKPPKE